MFGTGTIKGILEDSHTVKGEMQVLADFNVNSYFVTDFAGIYTTESANYVEAAGVVTGAGFVTRYVKKREWGYNTGTLVPELRYVDEEDWKYPEYFPISSIFKPYRPGPGIVKTAANFKKLAGQIYGGTSVPTLDGSVRIYPASKDAPFKYWRSGSVSFPTGPYAIQTGPFAHYVGEPYVNKITATVQPHAGIPSTFKLQYLNTANVWTTVWANTNGAWPANGRLNVYYNGTVWGTTPSYVDDATVTSGEAVKIRGVRLWVENMSAPQIPLEVIELSPRLVLDLSDRLVSFSTDSRLSEDDSPLPVGSISSNSGRCTIANYDLALAFDNTGSMLYGYQSKGANIVAYSKLWTGSAWEFNPLCNMYIDEYSENGEREIEVRIMDFFKYMQEFEAPNAVYKSKTLSQIVVQLCDWIGFTGVTVVQEAGGLPQDPIIPYFVCTSKEKVYDVLRDLAEAAQCSVHIDAAGVIKIHTFHRLMSQTITPSWRFSAVDDATGLANVESLEKNDGKPVNDVTIEYKPKYVGKSRSFLTAAKPFDAQRMEDKISNAWHADTSLTLGAASLARTLLANETGKLYMDQESGLSFGWTGFALINSEVIRYRGKEFHLKLSGEGTYKFVTITSEDEFKYYQARLAASARMYFTGGLAIVQRGAFGTLPVTHHVLKSNYTGNGVPPGWTVARWNHPGPSFGSGGAYPLCSDMIQPGANNSIVRIGNQSMIRVIGAHPLDGAFAGNIMNTLRHRAHVMVSRVAEGVEPGGYPTIYDNFGMGFRILGNFDSAGNTVGPRGLEGVVGMMFDMNDQNAANCWKVEVELSVSCPANNVRLYQQSGQVPTLVAQGTYPIHAAQENMVVGTMSGRPATYYELMIVRKYDWNNLHSIWVYVNGQYVTSFNGSTVGHTGRYGFFVRGNTYADFDYMWAANDFDTMSQYLSDFTGNQEGFGIIDSLYGGVMPNVWNSQIMPVVFNPDAPNTSNYKYRLDEFGTIVREVQHIKFDYSSSPALNGRIANMITSQGRDYFVPVFKSTPFGGEIIVVNTRRWKVAVNDSLSVNGNILETHPRTYDLDDYLLESYSVGVDTKIKQSRTIHGYSPLTIDSEHIQTDTMAKTLTDLIIQYSAINCDSVRIQAFGNPLVEAGDIVSLIYPEKGYDGTESFLVTSTENEYSIGYTTNFNLRRIK